MGQIIKPMVEWCGGDRATTLFMGGGISNCDDWQDPTGKILLEKLPNFTILDPRRNNWDMNADFEESRKQIKWEYIHLAKSGHILFWFPYETLCPIALFELGKWLTKPVNLYIGTHPNYQRRFDIIEQVKLERPNQIIHDNLDDLISEIITKNSFKIIAG